ncbi:MAG: nucleotidyltransferase domain-containing protein [Bacteroidaceae bacterium]|nr:nucleotidyltransferase domain-containing protein [Bacteroidaceae bacterium]
MNKSMVDKIKTYLATQPVDKAWLFGSFSRGEEREDSDVDILVQFNPDAVVGLFKYIRIMRELSELLNRKVDLVEEGTLLPFAVPSAERDKILIYEREAA